VVLRLPCTLRTDCPEYLHAITPYLTTYGEIIARAEISNGGPVILVQPENEYSWTPGTNETTFPTQSTRVYRQYVQDVLRKAGVTLPFTNNDNTDLGLWAPGTGLGEVDIYSFDDYPRGDAYHHWRLELPSEEFGNYTSRTKQSVIVKGGYLLRAAEVSGHELKLTGDINATTDFELLYDSTEKIKFISFNGVSAQSSCGGKAGYPTLHVPFVAPKISLPDLAAAKWSYIDTLPEISADYDDSAWTSCNLSKSSNTSLPKPLVAGDYGYFAGYLLYRGHFKANGKEDVLRMNATGGGPSIWSVWLNSTFLGSASAVANLSINSSLVSGKPHVLTVLIDHMGQDQITQEGLTYPTNPRGILDVSLTGHSELVWKMTGNLGGEKYRDRARGPLNEGGLFAERQGYHMPGSPTESWNISSPFNTGLRSAGVGFYATSFQLDLPAEYDIPIEFVFHNTTAPTYRVQLFVNGYQFGKFREFSKPKIARPYEASANKVGVPTVGPQLRFSVPEGILNYRGPNYVALTLRAEQSEGAVLCPLTMEAPMPIPSGYQRPASAPQPRWAERAKAY